MISITDSLKADEYRVHASYSNGKADLCGTLLQQFPEMDRAMKDYLFIVQATERANAIEELNEGIKLLEGGN